MWENQKGPRVSGITVPKPGSANGNLRPSSFTELSAAIHLLQSYETWRRSCFSRPVGGPALTLVCGDRINTDVRDNQGESAAVFKDKSTCVLAPQPRHTSPQNSAAYKAHLACRGDSHVETGAWGMGVGEARQGGEAQGLDGASTSSFR